MPYADRVGIEAAIGMRKAPKAVGNEYLMDRTVATAGRSNRSILQGEAQPLLAAGRVRRIALAKMWPISATLPFVANIRVPCFCRGSIPLLRNERAAIFVSQELLALFGIEIQVSRTYLIL